MLRSIAIAVLLVLAAGCASAPPPVKLSASFSGRSTSQELVCMSECLEADDEDCDSCAQQCLEPPSGAVAAITAAR